MLNLPPHVRLACQTKITGPVKVILYAATDATKLAAELASARVGEDPAVVRVHAHAVEAIACTRAKDRQVQPALLLRVHGFGSAGGALLLGACGEQADARTAPAPDPALATEGAPYVLTGTQVWKSVSPW